MSDIRNYFQKSSTKNQKRPRDADEKQTAQPKSNAHENLPKKKKLETPSKMVRSQSSTSNKSETSESVQKRQSSAGKAEASSSKKPATQPGKSKQSTEISAEPAEKRRRAQNFQAFRNRAGPSAPGSKEIPEGETNCLSGLTFVLSGVLESLDRDDCKALIERYAGRVTTAISGKTNFLILGREGSDAKENKAKELNIKILSEDDLIEMIRTRPGEKSTETKPKASTKATVSKEIPVGKTKGLTKATSSKEAPAAKTNSQIKPSSSIEVRQTMTDTKNSELWVDKYKPQSIKSLVGQQGDKSAVNKLIVWLRDWYKHHGSSDEKVKAKSSFGFNRNEDPAMFKAALLSGPPGIGKTTAAQLVCAQLNFEFVEKNASDQRSKKMITAISSNTHDVAQMLKSSSKSSNYVLIMDEVDGVAGNEDRGGIQELILLIKKSRIPIICICNDRQHKKIRTLANYCYDLRFSRPTVQQIRGYMLTILHREGIPEIGGEILDGIIGSCNQDIRQTIHTLNLWAKTASKNGKQAARMIEKNVQQNPFELCRLSFSNEFRSKSLNEKSEIFFSDYRLMPLLVQENYISSQPYLSSSESSKRKLTDVEHLKLLSAAADNISLGDICAQMIFSRHDSWSLLPYQGIFSTVAPCAYVRGHLRGAVSFSSFFGQRSRTSKNERLLAEIEKHTCLKIGCGTKQVFNLDYLPYLSRALINPLKKENNDRGIEKSIELLDDYYLSRDDFQVLLELNTWGKGVKSPYEQLEAQVKSAFTRSYNKKTRRVPFSTVDLKKLKTSKASIDEQIDEENEYDDDDQTENHSDKDETNPTENDAMIKIMKQRTPKRLNKLKRSK